MSNQDPYQYPKLRWPLQVQHDEVDGKRIIILSCPMGITDRPLGLHAAVAPILQQFQGTRSVSEILAELAPMGCTKEIIDQLIQLLDSHLFLETPQYLQAGEKMRADFFRATERPAYLAGLGYSADQPGLEKQIDELLTIGAEAKLPENGKPMVGLMSPHIDYRRGGTCYGITWEQIRGRQHDLYLVIGTSHQYSEYMFHLTEKDFASPLGLLACDKPFIQGIASKYGPIRSFTDEYLHRREHSLELQLPFLKRLSHAPLIAPVLVGSFHHMLKTGKDPQEYDIYESFIGALTEITKERLDSGSKVCVIAGVDMAHVGQNFGDSDPLTPEFMQEIEKRDRLYLDALVAQDKKKLWEHVEEDLDRRRICGFPTMYTVLDLYDRLGIKYEASLYDYRQAVDYKSQCAVTFAGMGFYQ